VVREEVEEYALDSGRKVYLLAEGEIVNIAGGLGHAADILDMSFALQLGCMYHFLAAGPLEAAVYGVPEAIDRMMAEEKLRVDSGVFAGLPETCFGVVVARGVRQPGRILPLHRRSPGAWPRPSKSTEQSEEPDSRSITT